MPSLFASSKNMAAQLAALDRSQAIIEFTPDGQIVTANKHFLDAMGYTLSEIKGRHHNLFVDEQTKSSTAYKQFWTSLKSGIYQSAEFKRIAKSGEEVWIQASYNPILRHDKPVRIVKYATVITDRIKKAIDESGQVAAISRSQAVIHFDLAGTVLWANDNFLKAMDYTLAEIAGRHHSMFVPPEERGSAAYAAFWQRLRAGQSEAAEYCRQAKGGRQIWIQATYNPILDLEGKPVKVVKFATDITAMVQKRLRREQIGITLEKSLDGIAQAIATTSTQATAAAAASSQTATNVQAVAAGAEEFSASIAEVSRRMAEASRTTQAATQQANETNAAVAVLLEATTEIEQVAQLITSIAAQTNLLALNATIEAARAGDAGKGFAVVASEVKGLAGQTALATDNISKHIAGIQAASHQAVGAIRQISQTVASINAIATSIAAAVEEQDSVAREMSANMEVAAQGVAEIDSSASLIAKATESAEASVHQVRNAAKELAA
jgi:methyl-accepting chemotaxis protein